MTMVSKTLGAAALVLTQVFPVSAQQRDGYHAEKIIPEMTVAPQASLVCIYAVLQDLTGVSAQEFTFEEPEDYSVRDLFADSTKVVFASHIRDLDKDTAAGHSIEVVMNGEGVTGLHVTKAKYAASFNRQAAHYDEAEISYQDGQGVLSVFSSHEVDGESGAEALLKKTDRMLRNCTAYLMS